MISIVEAFERIDTAIAPLSAEQTSIDEAVGHVLAEDVTAESAVPAFRQSAMDGYGLRASDVAEASAASPVRLEIVGEVPAGPIDDPPSVRPGEAVRIFTGAPVPEDVDAVVRQEKITRDGETLVVEAPVSAGNDLRPIGEELAEGASIGEAGRRLSAGEVGRAAMTGIDVLSTRPRPEVAVFVTGTEVRPAGESLRPGELYDANSPFLAGWLRERGVPYRLRRLPDERDEVAAALDDALDRYDLVVTTGGVSVGDYDHVVGTASEVGLEEVFWKIRQKPGKPVWFGRRDETPLLGLPGNPGAVFVGVYLYLYRVLDALQGRVAPGPNWAVGRLSRPVESSSSKAILAGADIEVDERGTVRVGPSTGHQSHRLSRLAGADGLAWIPEGEERLEEGETVRWISTGGDVSDLVVTPERPL